MHFRVPDSVTVDQKGGCSGGNFENVSRLGRH